MKTKTYLIVILILALLTAMFFCAKAQSPETQSKIILINACQTWDKAEPDIPFRINDTSGVIDIGGYARRIVEDENKDPLIHLSDLIEYQTECYNDSTKVWHHIDKADQMCVFDYGCVFHEHYGWVILHTQPTFTGFIQYLKSKQ